MVAGEKVNMITYTHACMSVLSGLTMTFKMLKMEVGGPMAVSLLLILISIRSARFKRLKAKGEVCLRQIDKL